MLVGGSATALYARHRMSFDHDHVLTDLADIDSYLFRPLRDHRFGLAVKRARSNADAADLAAVAARVRDAIAASGLTASAFAAEVGTSASRLSTYASGRVTSSAAMLLRIERRATG